MELIPSLQNKLNTFQLKGLRKMMKMKTTYIERDNTNEKVFLEANRRCKGECTIIPLSEQYINAKIKAFAKLLNLRRGDPRAEIVFQPGTLKPHDYGKKRVGRPRNNWIKETTELFWKKEVQAKSATYAQTKLNLDDPVHIELISEAAERIDK